MCLGLFFFERSGNVKAYNFNLYKTDIGKLPKKETDQESDSKKFFLFDYFDFLEIDDCLTSIEKPDLEDWIISKDSILKSLDDSYCKGFDYNKFSAMQKIHMCSLCDDEVNISINDTVPYILVLQLSFNDIFYKSFNQNELRNTITNTIIPKIKSTVISVMSKDSTASYNLGVFHLISSGDLAVVLQANTLKSFSAVQRAISLMSIDTSSDSDKESILFTLYSIMGVDISHTILPSDFNEGDKISIRCSFSEDFKQKILNNKNSFSLDESFNLIGPYDVSFEVSPSDFVDIYHAVRDVKLNGIADVSSDSPENGFIYFIKDGSFSTVNEQIFFGSPAEHLISDLIAERDLHLSPTNDLISTKETSIRQHLNDRIINVRKNIHSIFEKAKTVWGSNKIPSEIENAAYEYNRILTQVISSVSSKTKQDFDAIISVDLISLLTESTKKYLDLYKYGKVEKNCLVSDITGAVSMIGRYVNQMYAINLNNYESPVFFSSLPSASEKLVIAYTQFLMSYVNDVVSQIENYSGRNSYRKLVPLIEPDITAHSPGLQLFFSEVDNPRLNIVNIKSPSNHKLAHTVEQLSAFSHEIGHFFPYADRVKRNSAYLKMVLITTAQALFLSIFPEETHEHIFYYSYKQFFVREYSNYFFEKLSNVTASEKYILDLDFVSFCGVVEEYLKCTFSTLKDDPIKMLQIWIDETLRFSKNSLFFEKIETLLNNNKDKINLFKDRLSSKADCNPLVFIADIKSDDYVDFECAIDDINDKFSSMVNESIKNMGFAALDKVKSSCKMVKCADETIEECKHILEDVIQTNNPELFAQSICDIGQKLTNIILSNDIDKTSYHFIKRCVNLDLQELKTIYSNGCALVKKLYVIVSYVNAISIDSLITNHILSEHRNKFFKKFYDSFSLYLHKKSVDSNGDNFYSSFHKIGFYFQNDPKSGKDFFMSIVEDKLQMLSITTWLEECFEMSEIVFKETLADVIMIVTCGMGVKNYNNHAEFYLSYVDDSEGSEYQFKTRIQLASVITSVLARTKSSELAINKEWQEISDLDFEELNTFLGDQKPFIVDAMCEAISPTIKSCTTVMENRNYSTMRNLFNFDSSMTIQKEVEFLFDWFYNNRWNISNHNTFLLSEEYM